jgi:cyclic nucleotide-binding protein
VPGGVVVDPAGPPPPALAALPGAELAAVLADAAAFARDLQVRRRRSRFDVAPLCSGGELVRIFLVPPGVRAPARRRWQGHVRALNVRAAVAGVRRPPARPATTAATPAEPRVAVLRRSRLFGGLPTRTLTGLARATGERRITAGTPVVVEDEIGVGFFLIAEGRADVVVDGARVAGLGPGDHFGEIALIAGSARTATVVATSDLRCLTVTSWDFRRLVESDPEISWRVLTAMAAQLLPRIGVPGGEDAPAVGAAARPR